MIEKNKIDTRIHEIDNTLTGEVGREKTFVRKNGNIYFKVGEDSEPCELTKDNCSKHVPILTYFWISEQDNSGNTTENKKITIPPKIAIDDLGKLIKEFISLPIDQSTIYNWLHSATHFLEGFTPPSDKKNKFGAIFEIPEYQPIADALVNSFVTNTINHEFNDVFLLRVTNSISLYNLYNITEENLTNENFPFKPSKLNDPSFIQGFGVIPNLANKKELLFLKSKDPKEFIEKLVENDCYLRKDLFEKLSGLIKAVVGDEKFLEYKAGLNSIYKYKAEITGEMVRLQESTLDEIADLFITEVGGLKNIAENLGKIGDITSKPALEGIYVDVEKTLIIDGNLNAELVDKLIEAKRYGINITIFSSADPEKQTTRLKKLEMDIGDEGSIFSSVQAKKDYLGKNLLLLIDDTNAAAQGFLAVKYINPGDAIYEDLSNLHTELKTSIRIVSVDSATNEKYLPLDPTPFPY